MDIPCQITIKAGIKLALMPSGEFLMGREGRADTQPVHKVRIEKPFYVGVYPITQREWEATTGANPSQFPHPDSPVECVSLGECISFIDKLNGSGGSGKCRLPTEAEWEYACRAGSSATYSFGDSAAALGEYAWFKDNSSAERTVNEKRGIMFKKNVLVKRSTSGTHPVGRKKPNAFGLYDMHGNVWEWCQDKWHDNHKGAPADGGARAQGSGRYRFFNVIRGGAWYCDAESCSSASRYMNAPGHRRPTVGMRLVVDV